MEISPRYWYPNLFNQAIMFPEAKIWIEFVCTRIVPTLNVYNVNTFQAVLLYAILQKKTSVYWKVDPSKHEEMY
ncbi:hypothetical protein Godav_024830 [Gossypium davidsonii]|uniref:Uncharacterized protein n=1 Tax=Gossypium davidsonii TaxID=34287 RepID=A0A7J8TKM8_GOSDV|nr:hypothetical protein [Gossypium davidsonii]